MAKPTKPHTEEIRTALLELSPGSKLAIERLWVAVLAEMLLLYYPPFRADSDPELLEQSAVALRAYVEDLGEFDRETLASAWRSVRRGHKTERWPTIEAIRSACLNVASAKPGGAMSKLMGGWRDTSPEERDLCERAWGVPMSRCTTELMEKTRDRIAELDRRRAA